MTALRQKMSPGGGSPIGTQVQCVRATFFLVGEMAREHSSTVRRIFAEGHTIGTHSEDHPLRFGKLPRSLVEWEIDNGILDVETALGDPNQVAPFFRVPGLARSPSSIVSSRLVYSSNLAPTRWPMTGTTVSQRVGSSHWQ